MKSISLAWQEYISTINRSGTFTTRYYHYLRIQTTIQYFQKEIFNTRIKRCLDIGCNRGYYAKMIAEKGATVDAIDSDLDTSSLFIHPNIHYHKTDINDFRPEEEYDLILFLEVYEHIPVEQRRRVLEKIHNLLSEDGILLFSGPNNLSLFYGAGYCKEKIVNTIEGTTSQNWHYHIPFLAYQRVLEEAGFVIREWHTDGVFPILSDRMGGIPKDSIEQLVTADKILSELSPGFGANYYCMAKRKKMGAI